MFKHLFVPLDGSSLAESVLPATSYLAKTLNASVTLFHVIEKDSPKEIHGEKHLHNSEAADAYLKGIGEKMFSPEIKVDYHVHTAEAKDVAKSIVEHESEIDHDLIVMCTHGRGKAMHLLFGSIAQGVISRGKTPVLVIHPTMQTEKEIFQCKSMLVPLDGNPQHEEALMLGKDMATFCQATMHLIMVVETFGTLSGRWTSPSRLLPGTTSKMLEMSVQDAEDYLADLQHEIELDNISTTNTVLRGDPSDHILKAAKQLNVNLIVLGTHGKSGLDAIYSGSVTNKICSQCKIPLLLIPVGE